MDKDPGYEWAVCSRNEVDTPCGSCVRALQAGTICTPCIFHFLYCNQFSEQDPGGKVQFRQRVPVGQLSESLRSGVEARGQGSILSTRAPAGLVALTFREASFVWTRGAEVNPWMKRKQLMGHVSSCVWGGLVSVRSKTLSAPSVHRWKAKSPFLIIPAHCLKKENQTIPGQPHVWESLSPTWY